jgi:hypothetical protein
MNALHRGTIVDFDPHTYRATVRPEAGASDVMTGVNVSAAVSASDLRPGRRVFIDLGASGEPSERCILAVDGPGLAAHGAGPWQRTVASTQVVNIVGEGDLCRFSIPANALGADRAVRLTASVRLLNNSGASRVFALRIKLGSTTVWGDNSASLATSADYRHMSLDCVLQNRASNAQELSGFIGATVPSSTTYGGKGDINATAAFLSPIGGSAAEDTTAVRDLALTCELFFASASLSAECRWALLELL